jgi:hypothetical protein
MVGFVRVLLASLMAQAALPQVSEAATSQKGEVTFPSDHRMALASKTGVRVYYTDPGPNADGIDERPIFLRYPKGYTEQIDTFSRSARVSWSPQGQWLALTNYTGSNVADCLAVTPRLSGARKQSMADAITRSRFHRIARDLQDGEHVYVTCGVWISPSQVEVHVRGDVCQIAGCTARTFSHTLVYDFKRKRIVAAAGK